MVGGSRRLNSSIGAISVCVLDSWQTVVGGVCVDVDCRNLVGRCALDGVPVMQLDGFFWFFGDDTLEVGGCFSCPSSSAVTATPIAANAFTNNVNGLSLFSPTARTAAAEEKEVLHALRVSVLFVLKAAGLLLILSVAAATEEVSLLHLLLLFSTAMVFDVATEEVSLLGLLFSRPTTAEEVLLISTAAVLVVLTLLLVSTAAAVLLLGLLLFFRQQQQQQQQQKK